MLSHKLWQMAQIGAEWVLYVLLFLSLLSIAIVVERILYFWGTRCKVDQVRDVLRTSLSRGGTMQAHRALERLRGPVGEVLRGSLQVASDGGVAAVEEAAAGLRTQEKMKMERGLVVLGTLGNNAPFIGLFGTVLGIINAFRDLSTTQLGQSGSKLMGSISEALVATAVGLLLAIPAVLAFNFFQRRVKVVLAWSDALLHELLSFLHRLESQEPVFSTPSMFSKHRPAQISTQAQTNVYTHSPEQRSTTLQDNDVSAATTVQHHSEDASAHVETAEQQDPEDGSAHGATTEQHHSKDGSTNNVAAVEQDHPEDALAHAVMVEQHTENQRTIEEQPGTVEEFSQALNKGGSYGR